MIFNSSIIKILILIFIFYNIIKIKIIINKILNNFNIIKNILFFNIIIIIFIILLLRGM